MKLHQIYEDSNYNSVQPVGVNSWAGAKMAQDAMNPELMKPDAKPSDVDLPTRSADTADICDTSIEDTEKELETYTWMIPTLKDPTVK